MNRPEKYSLYLFDFDGTLANSLPFFQSCFNQIAEEFGFNKVQDHEWEIYRDLEFPSIMNRLGLSKWKLPLILRRFRKVMNAHCKEIPLYHGVAEFIHELEYLGKRFAIVSSNSTENIQAILGPNLAPKFQFIMGGTSLFGKAAKLRKALKLARVSAQDCIYIGDEKRDAEAAAEVGLDFAGVTYGYALRQTLMEKNPTYLFDSISDMSQALAIQNPQI